MPKRMPLSDRACPEPAEAQPEIEEKDSKERLFGEGGKDDGKGCEEGDGRAVVEPFEYLHDILLMLAVREIIDQERATVCDDRHQRPRRRAPFRRPRGWAGETPARAG